MKAERVGWYQEEAGGGVDLFRFDGSAHGRSASAAANTLLTLPIIKEFKGADKRIRKP